MPDPPSPPAADVEEVRTYPGGFVGSKSGAGTYQQIINQIPPHDVYVEPFCGLAAIWRHKRRARRSLLMDLDPAAIDYLGGATRIGGLSIARRDGLQFLRRLLYYSRNTRPHARVFVYCDPPYVRSVRSHRKKNYYRYEWTDDDHRRFLDVVVNAPWPVLISGYYSDLYARRLAGWRTVTFTAPTRGTTATEYLWANYPKPDRLHDYRFLGADYPERWRIHKRQRSWLNMLAAMPPLGAPGHARRPCRPLRRRIRAIAPQRALETPGPGPPPASLTATSDPGVDCRGHRRPGRASIEPRRPRRGGTAGRP